MHCQYCGLINGEDDHRCLRCGRRLTGTVIAAPQSYIGATALAMSLSPAQETEPEVSPARAHAPEQTPLFGSRVPESSFDVQPNLSHKVIPFEQIQRQAASRQALSQPAPAGRPGEPKSPAAQPRPSVKKSAPLSGHSGNGQGNLDFHPNAAQGERILATGVPAQVYGEGHVAPPMRRMMAGAMDVSMVLLGFGAFAGALRVAGVYLASAAAEGEVATPGFGTGKTMWITMAAAMIFISLLYGLIFAIARRETAGMNWTQLQLVTFDGSSLDGRDRAIRFVSAWLSYCSGGLGLLWALADEENLAFHDHISKTYPAEKGRSRILVRQRN
jgi:uncharacterized RDD family membrane protein YckC